MSYRPSNLVPRERHTPFLSLFIDIAALALIGGISTRGLWMLFPSTTPDPKPERPTNPVRETRAERANPGYLKMPDAGTLMSGFAGLIQRGKSDEATPLYLGAILTALADARVRGETPEQFLATGFFEAGLREPLTEWVRTCVMMNWSVAHEFGLLTPGNLDLMRRGVPPLATVGSFRGDAMEVILQPVNDTRYRTEAAMPKLVPARLAKTIQVSALNEAALRPASAPPPRPARDFSKR